MRLKKLSFRKQLENLINMNSMENGSNTPDFMLAEYLMNCLRSWDKFTRLRDRWYGHRSLAPGNPFTCGEECTCCEPVKGIDKYKKS